MHGGLRFLLFLLSGVPVVFSIFLGPGTGCSSGATTPTGPAEIPGPVNVDGLNPPDGATDFAPTSSLTVPFTEPMNTASVEAAFSLSPEAETAALVKSQAVSGTFTWNSDDTEMSFDPTSALEPLTRYCMRIAEGALTADGDAIAAFESCFTTGEESCPSADDPAAYETIFDGTCNYTEGTSPDESSTFDYGTIAAGAAEQGWSDQLGCVLNAACLAGESGCATMTALESAGEACGLNEDGAPLIQLTQETCLQEEGPAGLCDGFPSDGEIFTVLDLGGSMTVFQLYADLRFEGDDGMNVPGGVSYWVGAIEENRMCLGDCWTGPDVSSCNDQSFCLANITGQDIGNFLTARGKDDEYNGSQCVDMWWEWDANLSDGQVASNLLHVRIQKSDGICN